MVNALSEITKYDITKYRVLWLGCTALLPLVALQGRRLRQNIPRLPEAGGARTGLVGSSSAGRTLSIAVIGESSAAGVGVEAHTEGLPHHLACLVSERLRRPVRWSVIGRHGATLAKVQKHAPQQVEPHADAVVVLVGVNDTIQMTRSRAWAGGARALATRLREGGARRVVFSGLPPIHRFPSLPHPLRAVMGTRAKLLDAVLRDVASTLPGTSYAPVHFEADPRFVSRDGFHPSERGYAEWARNVAAHLVPLLARDAAPAPGDPAHDPPRIHDFTLPRSA
ncbi:SGNH/GDSL hydrolase family protein [Pendulispora albinea]|uniref:SGNH/GDSL hydrolase family protein n=1 Tax=Pendulispora albinea TaxID=2741071 RepID=A0ABZ2M9K2_9BACT